MLQRLELFATMIFEHYHKTNLDVAFAAKNPNLLNEFINNGTNFSSRICSCSECYSRTLLQLLTFGRKFEDIQTFSALCPKSPVDLSLAGNEHGHSIAYVLANANQALLLNNLIVQSSDVQINIAERHHGTSLIDILVTRQAWNCIITLVHFNMKSADVKYIPENRQIQDCPSQLRELIKENNALAQSKRIKKNTNPNTNKLIEQRDVNINANETVDTDNLTKEGKQEVTETTSKASSQGRIELLDQLLGEDLDYTLKVDKHVHLEIIDTKGNQTKKINALKLFLKTIPNANIHSNNHSIELEVRNLQILNNFIHAKYKVINDALTSQLQVSDTKNTFTEYSASKDSPTLKRAAANKIKLNKTAPIKQMIEERQTQRQQSKEAQKVKPQNTKSEPKKKVVPKEKSSVVKPERVAIDSATPIKNTFNLKSIEFIPAQPAAKRESTLGPETSKNSNNTNNFNAEQKSEEITPINTSSTQSSSVTSDTNSHQSNYAETSHHRVGLFAILNNRIVVFDIARPEEPSDEDYKSQSRMPKYLEQADKVSEQEYEAQSRLHKYLGRQ